jgi:hypothetical protein
MPLELGYSERLKAVNQQLGLPDDSQSTNGFDRHFASDNGADASHAAHAIETDDFAIVGIVSEPAEAEQMVGQVEPKPINKEVEPKAEKKEKKKSKSTKDFDWSTLDDESDESVEVDETSETVEPEEVVEDSTPDELKKEVDSIRFYIENGLHGTRIEGDQRAQRKLWRTSRDRRAFGIAGRGC